MTLTLSQLASELKRSEEDLRRLSRAAHRLYKCWDEIKSSGGKRRIEAPYPELKAVQQHLAKKHFDTLPQHACLSGGPGTSQLMAARVHVGKELVITVDLKNFFPAVTAGQVRQALARHGFAADVSDVLAKLCTRERRLPQGAPTSPVLARLVISPTLERIAGCVHGASPDAALTQYVDDMALSGGKGLKRLLPLIRRIFAQGGFTVNEDKTKVMPESTEQHVLGLKVGRRLAVSDKFEKDLKEARRTLPIDDPSRQGMEAWKRAVGRASRRQ